MNHGLAGLPGVKIHLEPLDLTILLTPYSGGVVAYVHADAAGSVVDAYDFPDLDAADDLDEIIDDCTHWYLEDHPLTA